MNLSQSSILELGRCDGWNLHEDQIYEHLTRWYKAQEIDYDDKEKFLTMVKRILYCVRFPQMSVEKLQALNGTNTDPEVAKHIMDALFFKLQHEPTCEPPSLDRKYRPRMGTLLFSWTGTPKVSVSGDKRQEVRHSSSSGFTGVRGDRLMTSGSYSWTVEIVETQS